MKKWLDNYFNLYRDAIFNKSIYTDLMLIRDLFVESNTNNGKIIIVGNGGSAAIASHCSVDLTKAAGIKAINFNEADLITCFANDYGYEHWVEKAIEHYGEKNDVAVLISSSGKSPNIVKGAVQASEMGLPVVTLSGFDKNNSLRSLGKINLWVDSRAYNVIEMTHQIWLLAIVDMIIGTAEYPA